MDLSINLRDDLAKLSDEELVARLDAAWERHRAAENSTPSDFKLWYSQRGPIRHPWGHYLFSVMGVSSRWWFMSLRLGPVIGPVIGRGPMGMHLALCEIQDIQDEIQRRVDRKKARAT
jgi:hypothetical protein